MINEKISIKIRFPDTGYTGDKSDVMKEEEEDDSKKDIEEIHPSSKVDHLIGYREPFHYCKQHLRVQNIHREEIEFHILYSKDHQQSPS